ncbi:uncharacterized protein LACBIDRAFT_332567 [Laccaria bicolor S238N-H82]|uniref:Predicted protein n=1 Tax=Laccaria bicolor (strain S238N-H82 / ATCC MYA-4686) TaxID=486041 RepID=B0DT58_LACBS|nr:uncharacterized protein LACBIDRAFT_332567 [Laccaria bicolor S238N-H82]EDR02163.1 predicted protein [Laccaria bicolor S238N-H82]|eukprot:XP_001887108.1 predicted protein [Laccaria bicolor S238N-H82]
MAAFVNVYRYSEIGELLRFKGCAKTKFMGFIAQMAGCISSDSGPLNFVYDGHASKAYKPQSTGSKRSIADVMGVSSSTNLISTRKALHTIGSSDLLRPSTRCPELISYPIPDAMCRYIHGISPNSRNVCPFSVVRIHPQLVVAIDCGNIANTNVPIADWALPITGSTYSPPLPEAFHAKGRKRTILVSTMPRVGNVGYSGREEGGVGRGLSERPMYMDPATCSSSSRSDLFATRLQKKSAMEAKGDGSTYEARTVSYLVNLPFMRRFHQRACQVLENATRTDEALAKSTVDQLTRDPRPPSQLSYSPFDVPFVQEEDPLPCSVEHSSPPSTYEATVADHPAAADQSELQPPGSIDHFSARITTAFDHLPSSFEVFARTGERHLQYPLSSSFDCHTCLEINRNHPRSLRMSGSLSQFHLRETSKRLQRETGDQLTTAWNHSCSTSSGLIFFPTLHQRYCLTPLGQQYQSHMTYVRRVSATRVTLVSSASCFHDAGPRRVVCFGESALLLVHINATRSGLTFGYLTDARLTACRAPPHLISLISFRSSVRRMYFNSGFLGVETQKIFKEAEQSFTKLEPDARSVVTDLLDRTVWSEENTKRSIPFNRRDVEILHKYFVFLRFCNSAAYRQMVTD